jgi:hypothetical protein
MMGPGILFNRDNKTPDPIIILGVQNPFYKKGFGRRRQKLAVDFGLEVLP